MADLTGMPYHLWPAIQIDGARLFEPELPVLRALDAACRSEPRFAAVEARVAVLAA